MLRLVGTAAQRHASRDRIVELAAHADFGDLRRVLEGQRLLPLAGTRLLDATTGVLPDDFGRAVDASVASGRRQAVLLEEVGARLLARLEAAGIPALELKGPRLSRRLHDDPAMRSVSADVDVLVSASSFEAAVAAAGREEYRKPAGVSWWDGLPLFEVGLSPRREWLPRADLHWRVHWYERAFSERVLDRSTLDSAGSRVAEPVDELAMLLLMFARDGFWGLRLPADVAAWWDRFGAALGEGGLRPIVESHPELRPAIDASAAACERLVGVPADVILPGGRRPARRRGRLAVRLANWSADGSARQYPANVRLVDLLLLPRGGHLAFARRHVLLPPHVIATMYRLPEGARGRRWLRRLWYAGVLTRSTAVTWSSALWRVRFGREWSPLPQP
jgi:hypothetical protein